MKLTNSLLYFLKAKFADTIGEGRKYDKDYHRVDRGCTRHGYVGL